jgi:hypothetical protein
VAGGSSPSGRVGLDAVLVGLCRKERNGEPMEQTKEGEGEGEEEEEEEIKEARAKKGRRGNEEDEDVHPIIRRPSTPPTHTVLFACPNRCR